MVRHRICSTLLLSFLLTSAPLVSAELYDDRRISEIEVVIDLPDAGGFDPKPVLARLKTKEGDEFSQLTFDNDLKNLSEEYDRVEPSLELKDGEVKITIHVTPKPVIHSIQWHGNTQFRTSTLQGELEIKPNTVFNRQEFNKAFNKVKEFYFKKGYFESQLSYSLLAVPGTNEVDIVVDVREGRPGYVKKIVFNGFTKAEQSDLIEQIYLKEYNFVTSWLTGSGIFRDEALEQDRATMINYLHNKGYADARVQIELLDDPESGKLIVEITAHRGQLYHFGTVNFQGNTLVTLEELQKRNLVIQGETFSPDKIRDTTQAIKDLYGQKGYIDASVQYETMLKEEDPIFDVEFAIDEGQQYKIGLVHIFGNSSTMSNVILRESLLCPGETFDSRKLKATQQRLEAVGYFKSVNVYAVRTADDIGLGENYRDVYIEVEETTTGNVSLFMGFSSMDDVFGGIDLTERNFNIAGIGQALTGRISRLRGGGEFFHVRGTVGKKQNNILISWMNPYVNDSLWRMGVELSRTFSELQKNVIVVTYGGSVTASYPLSTYWTAGMRQRLRHSKDDLQLDPLDDSAIAQNSVNETKELLDQKGLISAFSTNVSYDSCDNPFKPHRGWRSYFETEVAGIGGNYDFFKVSYLNAIYFPVWRKGTLKLRGDFKYIVPFGKTKKNGIPYSERFFLGGETTVRGYKPFLLGPVVELQNATGAFEETDTPFGGLSSSLLSLEYNQELLRMLDLFVFFDVGSLTFGEFKIDQIRPSTGIGLRLDIGNKTPIMVGYGYPLVKKDREDKWQKVFFSMGGQF
ncbi:MAG TPA: outer membrane protein assembly factor BamA [Chlamydiales bacterium]|nr:outer membrane protein assembly factor BamA [Chlamydiales bacterium]